MSEITDPELDLFYYYDKLSSKQLKKHIHSTVDNLVKKCFNSLTRIVRLASNFSNQCESDSVDLCEILEKGDGMKHLAYELHKNENSQDICLDKFFLIFFEIFQKKSPQTPNLSKLFESLNNNGKAFDDVHCKIAQENDHNRDMILTTRAFDLLKIINSNDDSPRNDKTPTKSARSSFFAEYSATSEPLHSLIGSIDSVLPQPGNTGQVLGKNGTPVKMASITASPFCQMRSSFNNTKNQYTIDGMTINSNFKKMQSSNNLEQNQIKKQTSVVKEIYHQNNSLYYRGETVDGKFHGRGEMYHPNCTLKYKGNFRHGGPHGKRCTIYHDNEKIYYLGEMIEGNITGQGAMYDLNGNLESEGFYVNERLTGHDCEVYYPTGEIKYNGSFCDNHYSGYGNNFYLLNNYKVLSIM